MKTSLQVLSYDTLQYALRIEMNPTQHCFPVLLKDGAYYCYCMRIRSAHLQILGFPIANAYKYRDIFARFKTNRRK